jgi:prepilin-type N-terminal cleavage/methylation domain-containing protein
MEEHVINQNKDRKRKFGNKGFTLIEILIVVMVLGILAMVIVPQITVSTTDAKESTLQTNIVALRNAIELYYHQHNNVYPGYNTILGAKSASVGDSATAFLQQLTQYTEVDGTVGATKAGDVKYGPYLKSATLPTNPFNDLTSVVCDITTATITSKAITAPATAWKFYVITGILLANDGGTGHADL